VSFGAAWACELNERLMSLPTRSLRKPSRRTIALSHTASPQSLRLR